MKRYYRGVEFVHINNTGLWRAECGQEQRFQIYIGHDVTYGWNYAVYRNPVGSEVPYWGQAESMEGAAYRALDDLLRDPDYVPEKQTAMVDIVRG